MYLHKSLWLPYRRSRMGTLWDDDSQTTDSFITGAIFSLHHVQKYIEETLQQSSSASLDQILTFSPAMMCRKVLGFGLGNSQNPKNFHQTFAIYQETNIANFRKKQNHCSIKESRDRREMLDENRDRPFGWSKK